MPRVLDGVLALIFNKIRKAINLTIVCDARAGDDVGDSVNLDEAARVAYDADTNGVAVALKAVPIEAAAEPTLADGDVVLWWDTDDTKLYLIHKRGATQYKVELT